MKEILFAFIATITLTTIGIMDHAFQYIFLFIFLITFAFNKGILISNIPINNSLGFYLPLIVIFVWFYGLVLALINGNNGINIIRNFAGMLFYIIYYPIINIAPKKEDLLNFLIKISFIYALISNFFSIYNIINGQIYSFDTLGFTSLRFYTSVGISIIFLPLSLNLFAFLLGTKNFKNYVIGFFGNSLISRSITLIICTITIVLTGSKGYYLSYIILLSLGLLLILIKSSISLKINLNLFIAILISSITIFYLHEQIIYIFSKVIDLEFDPNQPRFIQGQKIAEDFTLLGKGLGATLESGYARDRLGYGFELGYHNLFHKFGFFTFLLILNFSYPLFLAIKNLLKNENLIISSAVIGLMVYLVSGFGNPGIFAPINSLLNIIALYLITSKKNNRYFISRLN